MFDTLTEWFTGLSSFEIFMMSLGSVGFLILMAGLFLGMDGFAEGADVSIGDTDLDHSSPHLAGLMSVRTFIVFVTMFGWTGAVASRSGINPFWSVVLGSLGGAVMFVAVGLVLRKVGNMEEHGNVDYTNAVGTTGRVYVSIPPKGKGLGKVEFAVQGRMCIADAMNQGPKKIPKNHPVEIVEKIDGTTVVVSVAG